MPKKKPTPPKAAPRPRGRPSKYRPEMIPMAQRMTEMGYTQIEIAEVFGTTPLSIRNWRMEYPEFDAAFSIALKDANARVELSLYQQATGYYRDEEEIKVIEGKIVRVPVKRWYPPTVTASIYWSKVKMGWRDDMQAAAPENETVEDAGIKTESIRQTARRLAFVLHTGGKKESA